MNAVYALLVIPLFFPALAYAQVLPSMSISQEIKNVKVVEFDTSGAAATMAGIPVEVNYDFNSFLARLDAAVFRADKLTEKITKRYEKIIKTGMKNSRVNRSMNALTTQTNKLKTDYTKLQTSISLFATSTNQVAQYGALRRQLVLVLDGLKNSLSAQRSLITSFKPYDKPTPTQKQSATPKVVITNTIIK